MEKDKLEKLVGKIVGFESKQTSTGNFMSKIKTEAGDTFTLFHTKRDGTETKAFSAFKALGIGATGAVMEFLYKTESFVSPKDNKTYTSKKLLGMKPTKVAALPELPTIQIAGGEIQGKVVEEDNLESITF